MGQGVVLPHAFGWPGQGEAGGSSVNLDIAALVDCGTFLAALTE